jgi:hypothetical protein
LPNGREVATEEVIPFLDLRRKDQVEIRGIHVTVGDNALTREDGQRRDDRRLARATLTADDNQFLHV